VIYVYADKEGIEYEAEFPIGKAPKSIKRNGQRCHRKPVLFTTTAAVRPSVDTGYHRAYSQPKWWPYAPRHDKDGTPLYTGYNEIAEAEAKAKDGGEFTRYDR